MSSALPVNHGAAPLPVLTPRPVDLAAWALLHAVTRAGSSLTLQEGLYEAYRRDLQWLADVDGVPPALRVAIEAVVHRLQMAFGFDPGTGEKRSPSTLGARDARALHAELRVVSAQAEAAAARS